MYNDLVLSVIIIIFFIKNWNIVIRQSLSEMLHRSFIEH